MYGAHIRLVFVTPRVLVYEYRYMCLRHAQQYRLSQIVYFKGGRQLGILTS